MSQHDIDDWNRIAPAYISTTAGTADDRIYTQFADELWHSLGDVQGRTVLDVGCGAGWLSRKLVDAGAEVLGAEDRAFFQNIPVFVLIEAVQLPNGSL